MKDSNFKVSFLLRLKDTAFGGGNQFLKALKKYFNNNGIYEQNPKNADIILFNSFPFREEFRFKQAYKLKKKNKILIHRIDGPFIRGRNRDFELDKILFLFNNYLADGTIFQSKWSKTENIKLGFKSNGYITIIHNAPDPDLFNKEEKILFDKSRKIRLISNSWSKNLNKGFKIYKYLDENLDFLKYKMTFIGNSPIKYNNIRWIKPLKSNQLAKELKKHDIYICPARHESCSNSLLEALHCGLPSIAIKSGSNPEIIKNSDLIFNDEKDIIEKLEYVVKNYEFIQNNLNPLNINEIGANYYKFFEKIYNNFKRKDYRIKKTSYLNYLKIKLLYIKWKIKNKGIIDYIIQILILKIRYIIEIMKDSYNVPSIDILNKCYFKFDLSKSKYEIDWLYNLKDKIPQFLNKLKGKKRIGFYHYSLTGDYFDEKFKWGLGNSVFFLKIIYILGLEKEFKYEIKNAVNFIQQFQKKNGSFYDPLVKLYSFPLRMYNSFRTLDFLNIRNKQTIRAETRQSISALSLFNIKPLYEYKKFPRNEKKIKKFLRKLNWELPWGAGSHFSHLLFFLKHSNLENKNSMIEYAIKWINKLQHKENGFWYTGNPSIQQKINGAMKIITGLKVVNKVKFKYPKKLIDNILAVKNDEHACNNFNITFVLKYCFQITEGKYKNEEIIDFMYERLAIYKEYYYPKIGGFSFNKNKASNLYYNAYISKGRNEPDIHGTVMFLWGISLIAQTLKINDKLKFKEFIT